MGLFIVAKLEAEPCVLGIEASSFLNSGRRGSANMGAEMYESHKETCAFHMYASEMRDFIVRSAELGGELLLPSFIRVVTFPIVELVLH